jgi:hypothetical protein
MYLRRDQTCAVEKILGDLGPHAVRHLRIVQPLEQLLRRVVRAHDQPFGGSPPHLGGGAAVQAAHDRTRLGLAPAATSIDHVPVAPDHVRRQQSPSRLAVRDALHGQRFSAGKLRRSSTAAPGSLAIWSCRSYMALID